MPLNNPNVESHQKHLIKITPFGQLIRITNLDEIPQFWNVLKGDMSFIGPRPPIPSQTNLVKLRSLNSALKVRPGLTGWAQVNSYDYMPEIEKAKLDGEYAEGITLTLDLLILLKTVVYFTHKPPTY
jgi:O-antigen biosynthesis protein WbqP